MIWYDSLPQIDDMSVILDEHDNSVTDQGSWRVLADDHFTTRLCEELYDLPGSSNSDTDIICQKLLDFPFPPSCGEELDSEHGTEGLTRPISPSYSMLEGRTPNPLVSISPKNLVE